MAVLLAITVLLAVLAGLFVYKNLGFIIEVLFVTADGYRTQRKFDRDYRVHRQQYDLVWEFCRQHYNEMTLEEAMLMLVAQQRMSHAKAFADPKSMEEAMKVLLQAGHRLAVKYKPVSK